MRIHSDIITTETLTKALAACKADGRVGSAVFLDVLTQHGSRSKARAYEVQLGSTESASFMAAGIADNDDYSDAAKKRASRRHVRQWVDRNATACHYAPTWHEWGHFIAELFRADPDAVIGGYDTQEAFEYQTGTEHRPARVIEWALDYNGRAYDFMEHSA